LVTTEDEGLADDRAGDARAGLARIVITLYLENDG
jgi:hypothetical protein